jgi:hypothetical protein
MSSTLLCECGYIPSKGLVLVDGRVNSTKGRSARTCCTRSRRAGKTWRQEGRGGRTREKKENNDAMAFTQDAGIKVENPAAQSIKLGFQLLLLTLGPVPSSWLCASIAASASL